MPLTTRLAPICFPTIVIAVIRAIGIPSLSISFAIAAPLRVQVPQADTSRTPSIPSAFMSTAISFPIACIAEILATLPVVI